MKKIISLLSKFLVIKLPLAPIVILIALIAASYGTYKLMVTYPEKFGLLKGPSIIKKEEQALVAKVSRSLTLPTDEEPTIATVTEPEKLSEQFFFKNAQQGDRLLIYQNSRKVILYRPSEDKVVEVGVVNIKQQGEGIGTAGSYKLAIIDSTENTSLLDSLTVKVKTVDSAVEITEKNSTDANYTESALIDVKGDKADIALKVAQGLGVKVAKSLPEGEKTIEGVDFILLVGSDLASK